MHIFEVFRILTRIKQHYNRYPITNIEHYSPYLETRLMSGGEGLKARQQTVLPDS